MCFFSAMSNTDRNENVKSTKHDFPVKINSLSYICAIR